MLLVYGWRANFLLDTLLRDSLQLIGLLLLFFLLLLLVADFSHPVCIVFGLICSRSKLITCWYFSFIFSLGGLPSPYLVLHTQQTWLRFWQSTNMTIQLKVLRIWPIRTKWNLEPRLVSLLTCSSKKLLFMINSWHLFT